MHAILIIILIDSYIERALSLANPSSLVQNQLLQGRCHRYLKKTIAYGLVLEHILKFIGLYCFSLLSIESNLNIVGVHPRIGATALERRYVGDDETDGVTP